MFPDGSAVVILPHALIFCLYSAFYETSFSPKVKGKSKFKLSFSVYVWGERCTFLLAFLSTHSGRFKHQKNKGSVGTYFNFIFDYKFQIVVQVHYNHLFESKRGIGVQP